MESARPGDEGNMDRIEHSAPQYQDDYEEAQLRRAARSNRIRQAWYGLSPMQQLGVGLAAAGLLVALIAAL